MRRLASLFVIWLGLLSIAVPSLACAATTRDANCCPGRVPSSCGECPAKGAPHETSPAAFCIAAPSHAGVAAIATASLQLFDREDQPKPAAFPAIFERTDSGLAVDVRVVAHTAADPPFAGQSPAYLVTRRLRL